MLLTALLSASAIASHAPVLVHDRRESSQLTDAGHASAVVPDRPAPGPPAAYARVHGRTIQYWLFYAANPQDRGIVRTGRHEGDWELIQVTLDRHGHPSTVLASQHSGAEACPWRAVEHQGSHPVVYVARGSHAGYFARGTRDRTWPDPNDEAPGDGAVVRPRVARVTSDSPPWMRFAGRWGRTRKGIVPGEMDSPRGPAFQGVRWDEPRAFEDAARDCAAAAEPANRREDALTAALVLLAAGALAAAARRRRRRHRD